MVEIGGLRKSVKVAGHRPSLTRLKLRPCVQP